jgi:hypothetical protein
MLMHFVTQIFEFLTGRWRFVPREGPAWTAEQYHLGHMPGVSGDMFDAAFVRKGMHFDEYFFQA